jgi:hypothetical protein
MLRQLCRSDDARVEIDGTSLVNDVSTASVLLTRGRRVSASRMPGKCFYLTGNRACYYASIRFFSQL